MSPLRKRLIEDLQLAGYSNRTVECYASVVVRLSSHFKRSPDKISDEELRQFFLYLKNERKVSDSSFKQYATGIKFFFERTLDRQWDLFDLARPDKSRRLPFCISHEEVKVLLGLVRSYECRIALKTIYACGLRLSEATNLRVKNIDGQRRMLQVVQGKGKKDRNLPIPSRLLEHLREYWKQDRPKDYLFVSSRNRNLPMGGNRLQKVFKKVVRESGSVHQQATIHTLRHSYATRLLENGINIKQLKELLGHSSISTTLRYTHITAVAEQNVRETLDHLMSDL